MKIQLANLPVQGANGVKKVISAKDKLFKIATCKYGHARKDYMGSIVNAILTGKLVIDKDGNMSCDDKAKPMGAHRKFGETKGFDCDAAGVQKTDGWIVCKKDDIAKITNAINAFYNNELVKKQGVMQFFTMLRNCEEYIKDPAGYPKDYKPEVYVNELVPVPVVEA